MRIFQLIGFGFFLCVQSKAFAQDISLYQQFNGRYDYTAIGNTLNPFENNLQQNFCDILSSSQASLNLSSQSNIIAAYLYWAGSGQGDTNVTLNNVSVDAELVYTVPYNDANYGPLTYFSCFADVTELVISEGNSLYELSDLDISEALQSTIGYCENRTNFAGWTIYVIFENEELTLNQVNLFQGLEIISRGIPEKNIVLENLNVIDNENAKIGFLAWEGDNSLNYGESLSINGNILSNPPLNLANNAFNGTNSFTGSNMFYNGDLDVYDIQDNIQIGDTNALITLTTGGLDSNGAFQADLIILNNIITVLNSQLPDATIVLNDYLLECYEEELEIFYTVFNTNSTDFLPANTPIAFYANGQLIGQSTTQSDIPIDGSESGIAIVTLPNGLMNSFELTMTIDDDGTQNGIVTETNESNNVSIEIIPLLPAPAINILPNLLTCNEGFNSAVFDLTEAIPETISPSTVIGFFSSLADLEAEENELFIPTSYSSVSNPQTIYLKIESDPCYEAYQFDIAVANCPPFVPQGFSPNDDNINDWFNIQGLYDIFLEHELLVFNRYGTLIFEGNNSKPWDGKANRGLNNQGKLLPTGTYFYILNLNDPNYSPLKGWVYINY